MTTADQNETWTVVDDPEFYRGLFQRWKAEVAFQIAKVKRRDERLRAIRDVFRQLKSDRDNESLWQELHSLIFN